MTLHINHTFSQSLSHREQSYTHSKEDIQFYVADSRQRGLVSYHCCVHFRWTTFFKLKEVMVVYTKETDRHEPCNISERAPGRVPSQFVTYQISYPVRDWSRANLYTLFSFFCCFFCIFFLLLFLRWCPQGPLRIARWFCLQEHQLQWGERDRHMASVWRPRRLTFLQRAYG